ncbi:MAG TPA: hypothetical protein VFR07_04240 [Mycobacteriales bacterium]|nr:hypothetical protein [Mycobacteriales bacterium]
MPHTAGKDASGMVDMQRRDIERLEDHPNLTEVLGVLARLAQIDDDDLPRLADAWVNDAFLARARSKALSPDSPLVCEVLAAFEAVTALFEDDLRGGLPYVTVDPEVATTALKAVRDAVAAAYARPVLSRAEHAALLRPWAQVYPGGAVPEPDLGPQAEQVKALLAALPRLSTRCHDSGGRALWNELVDRSYVEEGERRDARQSAFEVAVLTRRRRIWALVRRSGAEGVGRTCPTCRRHRPPDRESERVLELCVDAACALLVADALPARTTTLLTAPITALVPAQRLP